jgi:hypothetical protein
VQASQNAALAFQANKSPEEKEKSARLLSLDGGGIRGLCLIQVGKKISIRLFFISLDAHAY